MLRISYTFLLTCILWSGVSASTGEKVKALMTSKWIGKYKQLKKDIEDKAATVKDMEQISDEDYNTLRVSYSETSRRLEMWLQNLESTLEKGDPADLAYFSEGNLSPALDKEFSEIGTFYANEFSTHYEEITGIKSRVILSFNDDHVKVIPPSNITWKFEHEELVAGLQPLRPLDWNSVN